MLTSFFALQTSIEKLSESIKQLKTAKESGVKDQRRMLMYAVGFTLALLVFVVELYLLFYTLKYVFKSTPAGPGRNVKVVLLVFFTLPYALLSAVVDPQFAYFVDKK